MQATSTPPKHQGSTTFNVEPYELLRALRRRKWLVIACPIIIGAAVALGTMRRPKIYGAKAQIIIEPVLPKILGKDMGLDQLGDQARAERQFLNTQYKTITSRALLRDVIARIGLQKDDSFKQNHGLQDLSGAALTKGLEAALLRVTAVAPESGSRIVNIIVEDQDPARAARIANTFGQAYIDYTLERRLENTRSASAWLDKRVEEFGKKLETAERNLYEFKKENTLVSMSPEDRQNMTAASMAALNARLVENRARLIEIESSLALIEEYLQGKENDPAAVPEIARSEVVPQLKATLATLRDQQAELQERYGERHPKMVAVQSRIREAEQQMNAEVDLVIAAMKNEVRTLEATRRGLAAELEKEKKGALHLNSLSLEYSKMARDFGTTQAMYESLLRRQSETDLSGRLKSNFVDWFQEAEVNPVPIRPSVPKNTAMALVIGLLLGLLLAVAPAILDNTVHSQADIEHTLGLSFLGLLPRIVDDQGGKAKQPKPLAGVKPPERDLFIVNHPKSIVAECARSIRTNLTFMGTDSPLRRLLVASGGPAEGKTTTAITLGVTLAQAGKRVLLIDTDLRRPRLHRTFGVSGEEGITSVLVEASTIDSAVKSTSVVGLDLLPCGPLPPNPAELLHTERFAHLLDELGERYDRIVLDSPPVGLVTDAAILSKNVDGTILVVQAGKTAKEAVRRATRMLNDVQSPILGVVLNELDLTSRTYGYSYYQYGYTYGSDAQKGAEA